MEFALLLQQTEFDDETTRLLTMAFNEVWEINKRPVALLCPMIAPQSRAFCLDNI
jgi:hypothetical protein